MIHPHTCIRYIDDVIGYGVFATQFLPKGTIVYVKDELEIDLSNDQYQHLPPAFRETVDKYSYIDEKGHRIVSWDFAKYVNHCCNCNTMSTGYGFEIAIRDIQPDEEITDEYGMFNMETEMFVNCRYENCRGRIMASDIDTYHAQWDEKVFGALLQAGRVEQQLWPILNAETQEALTRFQHDPTQYISVRQLKWEAALHKWNGKG
ncbi:MAG: SET domain-containing protein [Lewinellaceae bacterium]|nr:SET domain-containing protein [Lewinellaceae bacterium]